MRGGEDLLLVAEGPATKSNVLVSLLRSSQPREHDRSPRSRCRQQAVERRSRDEQRPQLAASPGSKEEERYLRGQGGTILARVNATRQ